jgi:ribosomal protein L7Ae-like RNA K-turn-binding protein
MEPTPSPDAPEGEPTPGAKSRRRVGRAHVRTCVGCGAEVSLDSEPMLRFVGRRGPEGVELGIDPKSLGGGGPGDGARGPGRGAHVHATSACLGAAARAGLARAFRGRVEGAAVLPLAVHTIERRIEGLLATAARTRSLAVGADAALAALAKGEADLVLVAEDAGRVALSMEIGGAVASGRAIVCSTKAELGHAARGASPEGVALVAITDTRLAAALRTAWVALGSVRATIPGGPVPSGRGAGRARSSGDDASAGPPAPSSAASRATRSRVDGRERGSSTDTASRERGSRTDTASGERGSSMGTSRGPVRPHGRGDGRR